MLSCNTMICLLLFILSLVAAQEKDRYIGIPTGTIHDSESKLSAEIYVADDHTIVFDKFSYSPQGNSCAAVIIGPARDEDEQRKVGPGILLPYAQLDFSWEDVRMLWKRKKRHSHVGAMGIDEMIGNLEIKNPRWRIWPRGSRSTTSPISKEASYEIIEYVDDEEETEENEEMLPKKRQHFIPQILQDGEVRHQKSTKATKATTQIPTTDTLESESTVAEITFSSSESTESSVGILGENDGSTETLVEQEALDFLTSLPITSSTTTTTAKPIIVFSKKKENKTTSKKSKIKFKPTTIKLPITSTTVTSTASTTHESTTMAVPKELTNFVIPPADNESVIFLLTNGAKITEYKWLGIWNACENKSTPHIWLSGVDPPREEQVEPLLNDEGNAVSGSIRILNCNTIFVQGLRYKPEPDRLSTFFTVGTRGNGKKEQRSRVKVIGYEFGEPLEQFDGDDIMLRLPKGIRTFDVDFLSIYNEDAGVTLAKVDLPSALVPPCND